MIFVLSSVSSTFAYSLKGGYTGINNQTLNFSNFENTVLLVDATASWCTACDLQLQNLNKVYDSVDTRVSILTLSIDANDELSKVAELKSRFNSKWVFGLDSNLDFKSQYEVASLPTLFLFNEDGILLKKWEGITAPNILLKAINEHLGDPFEPAFNTDPSSEVGTLFDDLFSNVLFRMVFFLFVVIILYLKFTSSPTANIGDTKS